MLSTLSPRTRPAADLSARISASVLSRVHGSARDGGMTTAEYAVGTVAACGFAGVLYKVITHPGTRQAMSSVIRRAFALSW